MPNQKKKIADAFASLYDDDEALQPAQQQGQASATLQSNPLTGPDSNGSEELEDYDSELEGEGEKEFGTYNPYPEGPVPFDAFPDPRFPSSAPKGFPRIISLDFNEDHDASSITLADGIATSLYRWEKASGKTGMLDKFFQRKNQVGTGTDAVHNGKGTADFAVDEYSVTTKKEGLLDVTITRKYKGVIAGISDMHGGWERQVLYRIEDSGKWTPVGSYGLCTPEDLAKDPQEIEQEGVNVTKVLCFFRRWLGSHTIEEYEESF